MRTSPQSKPQDLYIENASFTLVTSENPSTLTKRYESSNGKVQKQHGGKLISGKAEVKSVASLEELSEILMKLSMNQALVYGIPEKSSINLVTSQAYERAGKPDNCIPRTKEYFFWPKGPGIMMIDYDPASDNKVLTKEELLAKLYQAVPEMRDVDILWWPSASSNIINEETKEVITGLRGQRLYFIVDDAQDIPRAGKLIFDKLWLNGEGHIKISSSGCRLVRTIIDSMVWQTNRLDFAAGADCQSPLRQERGEPELIAGEKRTFNTQLHLPDLSEKNLKNLQAIIQNEMDQKTEESKQTEEKWRQSRISEIAGLNPDEDALEVASLAVNRALKNNILFGEFLLHVRHKNKMKCLPVSEILASTEKYDNCETLDPIEPEYDDRRVVGKLYLSGPRKILHSFARGEKKYFLEIDKEHILISSGKLADATEETLNVLRKQPAFFDRGDDLVTVEDGQIHILDQHSLLQTLGKCIQFEKIKHTNNGFSKILIDGPAELAKRIISLGKRRKLKPLLSVITAPTIRKDGTLIQENGYDKDSQLFFAIKHGTTIKKIESAPSINNVAESVDRLFIPFDEFPFVGPIDNSVFLAALLTAAVRQTLPTAPAFGFDAPIQGSGKSLLANCISALATGGTPRIHPHTANNSDDEVRKRLLSFYREGSGVMVWDNVLGTLDSAAFSSALTSEIFSDRILGKSETANVSTRAMMLITGNNLSLKGDMVRRVLICRIDPREEHPHDRRFDVDPLKYVLENRMSLIADCLTILRGYLVSDKKQNNGRLASFEEWSDVVRNAVVWVADNIYPDDFSDPVNSIDISKGRDPEQVAWSDLLEKLSYIFGDKNFSSADVINFLEKDMGSLMRLARKEKYEKPAVNQLEVRDVISQFSERATTSALSLGKVFSFRKDRVADGLVLRASEDKHNKQQIWRVEKI